MESNSKAVLDEMIKSVITRDGKGSADTMLVSSHLSQMKMFGIRQGVEFYPQQDNFGTQRFDFIQQVIKFNQLESLWMSTNLMCIGEKTSAKLNEIKWKKIFLFNPGEEEFLLYKI